MTLPLVHKMIESLNLDQSTSKHFIGLCSKDFTSCKISSHLIDRTTKTTQQKISKTDKALDFGFENYYVPMIFAALGSPQKGASLGTLQKRTNLELDTINSVLQKLADHNLVITKGRLYYPQFDHAKGKGLGSKSFFKNYYLRCLEETHRSARQKMDSDSDLFFASHILVHNDKIPELKKALRELLFQFVDDHLEEDGNQVKNLVCSFI